MIFIYNESLPRVTSVHCTAVNYTCTEYPIGTYTERYPPMLLEIIKFGCVFLWPFLGKANFGKIMLFLFKIVFLKTLFASELENY